MKSLLALFCALVFSASSVYAAAVPAAPVDTQVTFVAVAINGSQVSEGVPILTVAGVPYIRSTDVSEWRLHTSGDPAFVRSGETYVALTSIAGASSTFDESTQTLRLNVPSSSFERQVIDARVATPEPPLPTALSRGARVNYTIFGDGPQWHGARALFDAQLSTGTGSLEASVVSEDLFRAGKLLPLDFSYTRDDVPGRETLRVGNAVTASGALGQPSRFIGIQLATNFAVDPTFITYPIPIVSGASALPSTVQILVDNQPRGTGRVAAGPFDLQNVPLQNGAGAVQLVVTDALGREHLIVAPYYSTQTLLRKGLTSHAFEIGEERLNYGIESMYRAPFAETTVRHGFSDRFTAEGHVEVSTRQGTVGGLEGDFLLGHAGIVTLGAAASTGPFGRGLRTLYGYDFASRHFGFGVHYDRRSSEFREVGDDLRTSLGARSPSSQFVAHATVAVAPRTSLSATYVYGRRVYDTSGLLLDQAHELIDNTLHLFTATLTRNAGRRHFELSGYREQGATHSYGIYSRYLISLGQAGVVSMTAGRSDGALQDSVFFSHGSSRDVGVSYGVGMQPGPQSYRQVSLVDVMPVARTYFDMGTISGQSYWQMEVDGSFVHEAKRWYPQRRIDDSYALVQIPGFPNVRVFANDRLIGRTDKDGSIIAASLSPYHNNEIRIDESDLPLDVKLDVDLLRVNPVPGAGTIVRFATHRELAATVRLVDQRGTALPAGSMVSFGEHRAPVAEGGVAYLQPVHEGAVQLAADAGTFRCRAEFVVRANGVEYADLGTIICR